MSSNLKSHEKLLSGLPAELGERARAIAAAPESLVSGIDVALAKGETSIDAETTAQLSAVIRQASENYVSDIEQENGADRVAALRDYLGKQGLDGFVVPMADEHQNEYVPRHAQRLSWLSGFLGSAGTIVVLAEKAAIFVDGRYTLQVRDQVDLDVFETLSHLEVGSWIEANLPEGGKLAYDSWLHTEAGVKSLRAACEKAGGELVPADQNPVDSVWTGQPPRPLSRIVPHLLDYAGEASSDKRQRVAASLEEADLLALSATDSIAWLLNIRGSDVGRTPLSLAYGLLHKNGDVDLFVDPRKVDASVREHLGNQVRIAPVEDLGAVIDALGKDGKTVRIDPNTAPAWIMERFEKAGSRIIRKVDPVQKPKAIKNEVELAGTRSAHERDGVALAKFLFWLSEHGTSGIDELEAAAKLQGFRAENDLFRDLSFDTISGSGPNGAIVHYRVSEETNRTMQPGELFLVDSGGQYLDGTTDVTRTIAIGEPDAEQRDRFTRVLKGHIALAQARFPKGTTGHQLDVLARSALWQAGLDFKHGTGHGVGSYLGVHEGPHSISPRPSSVALEPGMIVSNEPGYYREGAYGIRIENLIAVKAVEKGEGDEAFYGFETLTLAPIDRALIDISLLSSDEISWLDTYHQTVLDKIGPRVDAATRSWLETATAPLTS